MIVPPTEFLARSSFLVAPLNTSEIVIFGGLNWGHVATYLNDTWIFDTVGLTFSQVASGTLANGMINKGSQFKTWGYGNQCAQLTYNKVIALVEDTKDQRPHVISFERGQGKYKIMATLPN